VFLDAAIGVGKAGDFQEELEKYFSENFKLFEAANLDASKLKCQSLLEALFGNVLKRHEDGEFSKSGGYKLIKLEFLEMERKYLAETR
jgi:hypothetical protein